MLLYQNVFKHIAKPSNSQRHIGCSEIFHFYKSSEALHHSNSLRDTLAQCYKQNLSILHIFVTYVLKHLRPPYDNRSLKCMEALEFVLQYHRNAALCCLELHFNIPGKQIPIDSNGNIPGFNAIFEEAVEDGTWKKICVNQVVKAELLTHFF